jgi:2-C-methyl-D-erythritol 4-phosphate cytidylyltransferase
MASAIILAAGSGQRMNSPVPKQYLNLAGVPVLSRTLLVFDNHPAVRKIFLVVAPEEIDFCRDTIISPNAWKTAIMLVPGGKHRQDSVHEGLKAACDNSGDDEIVLIHDGVRPLVPPGLITACIGCAEKWGACIPGLPASDTLKRVDLQGVVSETIPRENVWMVQTPQAFSLKLIREGFERISAKGLFVTDDAAVIESDSPVRVIPGSRFNIKITTPGDLDFGEALLEFDRES